MNAAEVVPHVLRWLVVALLAIAVGHYIVHTLKGGHR